MTFLKWIGFIPAGILAMILFRVSLWVPYELLGFGYPFNYVLSDKMLSESPIGGTIQILIVEGFSSWLFIFVAITVVPSAKVVVCRILCGLVVLVSISLITTQIIKVINGQDSFYAAYPWLLSDIAYLAVFITFFMKAGNLTDGMKAI